MGFINIVIENKLRQTALVMSYHIAALKKIARHVFDAHGIEFFERWINGRGSFLAVTSQNVRGCGSGVQDNRVKQILASVLINCANVVCNGIAGCFARLGHQIRDIYACGARLGYGAGNTAHQ